MTGTLGPMRRRRRGLRLLFVALLLRVVPAAAGSLSPDAWGGSLAVAYDHRAPGSLGLGNPEDGTGDPQFWFARPEDWQGSLKVWAQKKTYLAGQRLRIELAYERQEWAHARILGRNIYTAVLRQNLSPRERLELGLDYTPQVYLRHRVDKDAPPGAPLFRPQAYEAAGLEIGYRRSWSPEFHTTTFLTYEIRNEKPWFNERDRQRAGVGFSVALPVGSVELGPLYALRFSRTRNEPDLGSDRSYREHLLEMQVQAPLAHGLGPLALELKLRWKVRSYTTKDPKDTSRFGRHEQIYQWMIKVRRPIGNWAPFISGTVNGRWVKLPGEESQAEEDGEVDRRLIRVGVDWRY